MSIPKIKSPEFKIKLKWTIGTKPKFGLNLSKLLKELKDKVIN